MDEKRCDGCAFCAKPTDDEFDGACVNNEAQDSAMAVCWPNVGYDDWCDKWEPKATGGGEG